MIMEVSPFGKHTVYHAPVSELSVDLTSTEHIKNIKRPKLEVDNRKRSYPGCESRIIGIPFSFTETGENFIRN